MRTQISNGEFRIIFQCTDNSGLESLQAAAGELLGLD
jgi:hypothetical protein